MFGFNQIQSWPTPEMFVQSVGGLSVQDYGIARLVLANFVAVLGQPISESDALSVGVSLSAFITNGAQPLNESNNYLANIALTAFVAVTADNIGTLSEDVAPSLVLSNFVAVTAQAGTTKQDDYVVNVALSAFVI